MKPSDKILIAIAVSLAVLSCARKAGEAVAETAIDILLPSDATPCDAPAIATPSDGTPICGDVTEAQ